MLNKKAESIGLTIFVFLAYALIIFSLFSFASNSRSSQEQIIQGDFILEAYKKENLVSFHVFFCGEKALVETYYEFINREESRYDYLENPQTYPGIENFIFEELNPDLKEEFLKRFKENFEKESSRYYFLEDKKIKVDNSRGNYIVSIEGFEFKNSKEGLDYSYNPIISNEFSLEILKLNSFEEIYYFKESCLEGTLEERKSCYEEKFSMIDKFDVSIEIRGENDKYLFFDFISKKDFLVENSLEKFNLDFVVR